MQMLDSGFDLIILLLADHEMNAFRIDIAQRFTECGNLVVFAAQTNHQHCARVRVAHHVLQHSPRIDVIVAQL